tara:strand:- start:601 stop:744 length:144 start_codon:yes stop_codon:yes gene_type:complete
MSENLNSNNMENDITNLKYVEIDYRNLINKLREIKKKIALLKKIKFN